MSKKLAIRGHSARGKEVIELLEMMGGSNIYNLLGNNSYMYYANDIRQNIIRGSKDMFDEDIQFFNLEEFLEKYPFKVGDKVVYTKFGDNCDDYPVTIESMKWTGTTIEYTFNDCVTCLAKDLRMWNSNDNYVKPSKMKNVLAELLEHIKTTPKKELEREFEEIKEWSDVGPTVEEFMDFCDKVKKKPKYPTTYAECKEMMSENTHYGFSVFMTLQNLIICRDAYWKIYGEEMGLGKPWKPDWNDDDEDIFCIYNVNGTIYSDGGYPATNKILVFPTEEMRDAFYKNFDYLIEACKELL